jgi:hypothetical protein
VYRQDSENAGKTLRISPSAIAEPVDRLSAVKVSHQRLFS